ncbi:RHS domain-containing protein [Neisseria sp. Dent CA1/247]|uniref:RHS repeat-associated core domain-containing protein n=1 Tax=Neisseria sp. Dent CA1/247 TaxID=2912675 RepID=UPI001FD1EA7D|nr:RHS repeat-associated core domain-containing protein [Neisseria sp. Dent CA1/247]UOO76468.1 RHS domain-containing protein [Neisseria sp. Dent CA1/247]
MRLSYNSDGLLVKEQYQTLGEPIQPGIITSRTQDGIPLVTEYRYDILGNRTQTILPTGETLNYLYYGSGHLHHINLDGDTITDIERDDLHRPVSRSAGKLHTRLISDPLGRLKEQLVQLEVSSGKATELKGLIKRRYHYDAGGNLVQTEDQHHGNKDYAYDPLGRITRAGDERFAFDPAHNISGDGVKVTGNRLTDYNGIRYVYDQLGNLSERHNDATGESQYYRYDADNQLTEARIEQTGRPSEHWHYRYDALGRRVSKQNAHNQRETRFLWEGSRLLQEYSDKATYTYVYTEQGSYEPLAQIVQTANRDGSKTDRQILYYHNDQIGIPHELTDGEGNIVWCGEYSGWGKLNNAENANLKEDVHQPFRLQNQYADRETGLHYNFFRYYDPHCGRFTQQDPIGLAGGDNLYTYFYNIFMAVDALGLDITAKATATGYNLQGSRCLVEAFGYQYSMKDGIDAANKHGLSIITKGSKLAKVAHEAPGTILKGVEYLGKGKGVKLGLNCEETNDFLKDLEKAEQNGKFSRCGKNGRGDPMGVDSCIKEGELRDFLNSVSGKYNLDTEKIIFGAQNSMKESVMDRPGGIKDRVRNGLFKGRLDQSYDF